MKKLVAVLVALTGCFNMTPLSPQQKYDELIKDLSGAKTEKERFYFLNHVAKTSFALGKFEEARKYAEELRDLTPRFQNNWNYGNAIQEWNIVLGRLAVKEGRIDEAKAHLLAAGNSPGSPQLNSFGPNMSLAKDLLTKGEQEVVLEYFTLCGKFWKRDRGELDKWSMDVKAGRMPDFGANMFY